MTKIYPAGGNPLVLCQLAIERCQVCLAHLHAIMHLCRPENLGLGREDSGHVVALMSSLERELAGSAEILARIE